MTSDSENNQNSYQWRRSGEIHWCPGCGNYALLDALIEAFRQLRLEPWQVCIVSGIGQAGKVPHYLYCNFLHGLHGRALAHAEGVKLTDPGLMVIAIGGDGDIYGEGGGHLIHALRRNLDLTCIVHNNGVYGLTKGQPSPTAKNGYVSRISPQGTSLPGLNPLALAIAAGGTFVARGYVGHKEHLVALIAKAVKHRGFGFVDVLQPCVTYNRLYSYSWFKERVYELTPSDHDPTDRRSAFARALEWPRDGSEKTDDTVMKEEGEVRVMPKERIPIGIFYVENRETYEEKEPGLEETLLLDGGPTWEQLEAAMAQFR